MVNNELGVPAASSIRQRNLSSIAKAPSTTSTTAPAAPSLPLLVPWADLEPWRRDNAFIHTGYRRTSYGYAACFHSLGYLHNESVNIWTHLLGALVPAAAAASCLFLLLGSMTTKGDSETEGPISPDVLAFGCFAGGALACLGMSATYHAIGNHSEAVAKWGNKLDYTGIVFLIVGSYVPALYYGLFCEPLLMSVFLCLICLLGMACLVVSWAEHFRTPRWRPYRAMVFVGLGVSGVVPVVQGLLSHGYQYLDERMGLSWVLLQGALYIGGAFIYAVRWPESRWPGKFDIWGSSHQIFHVLILLAAGAHLKGMVNAYQFHHSGGGQC